MGVYNQQMYGKCAVHILCNVRLFLGKSPKQWIQKRERTLRSGNCCCCPSWVIVMCLKVCVFLCLHACVCIYVLSLECIRKTKAATNGKQNVAYSEAFAEACHTCKCKCKKAKANIKHKTRLTATAAKVSARCRVSTKTIPGNIGLQNFVLLFKLVARLRDRLREAAAVACHTKWILHGILPPIQQNINGTLRKTQPKIVIMLALWQTFCTGAPQLCAGSRVAIFCSFS